MNANDISRLIVLADSARGAIPNELVQTRLCAAIHELRKARLANHEEGRYHVEIAYWAVFDKWPAF